MKKGLKAEQSVRCLVLFWTVRRALGTGRNGKNGRNPSTLQSLLPPLGVPTLQELNGLRFFQEKTYLELILPVGVLTASPEHRRPPRLIGMKSENLKVRGELRGPVSHLNGYSQLPVIRAKAGEL